ncbi:RNA polymerase sigma factor [Psychrobacillus sp.]|uniref:RNA polymerase sigma factor n=1 Tax=Psychrobacillus sp. TaxID=1871623 RepID=UPI0028BDE355|nr:RNA polymerase sigma factor [Psychrobacillus sp.]
MRPLVEKTPDEMNEEFEMAVLPYMHVLRKYCLSLTRTKWDGEDLLQETLVKAYKSWMKTPKPMAKAYLYRIASNTWIDKHRKRKIEEDMNRDLSQLKREDDFVVASVVPVISNLLSELTAKQRAVILFIFGFGYTAKETAGLLSVSEGSVKAALHRARKGFKRINIHSYLNELDEEKTLPYITALNSGDPDAVVRLYRKEMQEPFMQDGKNKSVFSSTPMVQSLVGSNTSYVLIPISKKNGGVLFIPFYQLELAVLLSQIAWLKQKEFLAVA